MTAAETYQMEYMHLLSKCPDVPEHVRLRAIQKYIELYRKMLLEAE